MFSPQIHLNKKGPLETPIVFCVISTHPAHEGATRLRATIVNHLWFEGGNHIKVMFIYCLKSHSLY